MDKLTQPFGGMVATDNQDALHQYKSVADEVIGFPVATHALSVRHPSATFVPSVSFDIV
jgi:hypothetical protein